MNIITKIECGKRNKDRVNIYIDEEYAFSVDMEIVYKEVPEQNRDLAPANNHLGPIRSGLAIFWII